MRIILIIIMIIILITMIMIIIIKNNTGLRGAWRQGAIRRRRTPREPWRP